MSPDFRSGACRGPSRVRRPRIVSLDQFRGYTVLGMFLVNFVGSYAAVRRPLPILGHHHTYCSYADTIMPQFFFAVGFAYRLTFLRRSRDRAAGPAYGHALRRNAALLLVAFVVHSVGSNWQTWSDRSQLDSGTAALGQAGPVPDADAHRGHIALGAAGDRRPAERASRLRRRLRAVAPGPVVLVQLPLGEHVSQRRGRRSARLPHLDDPAAGRLTRLRRLGSQLRPRPCLCPAARLGRCGDGPGVRLVLSASGASRPGRVALPGDSRRRSSRPWSMSPPSHRRTTCLP